MRQVPHYLIIGSGRVARHISYYLSLINLPYLTWQRSESIDELQQKINRCTHVLLLISDHAIENFYAEHLSTCSATIIHFSGSHISEHIHGAHPLMSFSDNALFDIATYQSIPFIIDEHAPDFSLLLPGLVNQHVRLNKTLKEKYHALCVLGGNFSCMLWQKLFSAFESELGLPASIAHPYLRRLTESLISHPSTALTGPLTRNDTNTINKNLASLNHDPFQDVYQSFVSCYQKLTKGE
jgi:predicted short-subunit dehydrogenase-like oxidoreductase (DUF2520 family)